MGTIGFFFLSVAEVGTPIMVFVLAAALMGFLPYNFHPAKLFLGDTGALYIGFMLSVLSLQGLKKRHVHHAHHPNHDSRRADYRHDLRNYSPRAE